MKDEKFLVSLHEEAKKGALQLKMTESRFIEIIKRIDKYKVYLAYNYPNLDKYLVVALGLSEHQAYDFRTVARACNRFEKLDLAIKEGRITVSKARRIAPILDKANQEQWLHKAHLNSNRDLEKLVAKTNPEVSQIESSRYISKNQIEVKIVLSEEEFNQLKRAQDILCQKEKKQVGLCKTITRVSQSYIQREDPTAKAMRVLAKKKSDVKTRQVKTNIGEPVGTCRTSIPQRIPIGAELSHQVQLRDQGRCQEFLPNGQRCLGSKWVDRHHIKAVSEGGQNTLENLVTLCKGHHRLQHFKQENRPWPTRIEKNAGL